MAIHNHPGAASAYGTGTSVGSGSAMLDRTPPSPAAKIYRKPSPPGADTKSLLGGTQINDEDGADASNASLSTPGNKLMLSQAMFMQAANLRESVRPGSTPPPVLQWIAQQMDEVPQVAEQMARGGSPGGLLSALSPMMSGMSGMSGGMSGAPTGAPPIAATAMGQQGGVGGAGPNQPGQPGQSNGGPPTGRLLQFPLPQRPGSVVPNRGNLA